MNSKDLRGLLSRSLPGLKISLRSNFENLLSKLEQTNFDNARLNGELEQLKSRYATECEQLTDSVQALTVEKARLDSELDQLKADYATEQTRLEANCEQLTDAVQNLTIDNARLAENIKLSEAEGTRLAHTLAYETAQFQQRLGAQELEYERKLEAQESEHRRLGQDQELEYERKLEAQESEHRRLGQDQELEYKRKLEHHEIDFQRKLQILELDYQRNLGAIESSNLRAQLRDLRELRELHRQPAAHDATGENWSLSHQVNKRLLVVVMTTVSQLPQIKALAGSPQVRDVYDIAVVAYVEVKDSGLLGFCKQDEIILFSHRLELLCGNPIYKVCGDPQSPKPYFGAAAPWAAFAPADRRSLEHANSIVEEIYRQNAIAAKAQQFLRMSGTSILVLFEDNAEYDTGAWVTGARIIGVPVVIVPYAIIDPGDAAEAHYNDPMFWAEKGALNQFIRSTLPHWLYSYRDRLLIRRRAPALLSSEALGYAPPQPWVWNSSNANVLAVESEAMREVYQAQRIPATQIEVTGSIADDLLYEALRRPNPIREQLGFDARRPVLVCGFPPNQLAAQRPECEFHDFKKIVDLWLGELRKLEGWQIVVKPHPAMAHGDVEYLKTFPFPVADLDTTALIAICDVFNTSVSSTIRWALACGKPVLNYDVYRYRYQDFVNEPAVITVFSYEEFARQLSRLTKDRQVLDHYTNQAKVAAKRWGALDGQSTKRILNLFDRLIDEQK